MESSLAFEQVTSAFYRHKDGELAAAAFRHLVDMTQGGPGWPQEARFANIIYLFCRIAQTCGSARDAFEAMVPSLDDRAATLLRRILEAPSDPSFPNALEISIASPAELDLLWAEFFVTGSREPILHIISTLDWDDRVRHHLTAWLREHPLFGGSKRRETAALLESVGIVVDLGSKAILTAEDLDCVCYSIAERKFPIFKHLPFTMPTEDILALGTKGSALWSLRLNSTVHEAVEIVCESERGRPGGRARLRLTEAQTKGPPFAL